MSIPRFMQTCKQAWETGDEHLLASLFSAQGCYHNTPFAVQRGHTQIKQYWQRTKLQRDVLGNWKLQKYRFRLNCYVPIIQLFGSFQSLLKVSFLDAA